MPLLKRGIVPFVAGATALSILILAGWLFVARDGQTENGAGARDSAQSLTGTSTNVTVTREAGYRQASKLFRERNYSASISALNALSAGPTRTEADRVFLRRQREICQRAEAGMSSSPSVATAPFSSSAGSKNRAKSLSGAKFSGTGADCGPRALLLLCKELKLPATLPLLSKTAGVTAPRGASLEGLSKAAKAVGFAPEAIQMDRDALANLSVPAIAWVDGNHYVAVYEVKRSLRGVAYDSVLIQDPNKNGKENLLLTDLLSRSGGVLLTLPQPKLRQASNG